MRLIFLLLSVYIFCNAHAGYLALDNGNISCFERNCYFKLENNKKLSVSLKDNRVLEFFTEDIHGKDKLTSYLFYTTDIVSVVAYSGKPLEILISLSLNGIINDLKLVKHSEPILLTGIPIEKLLEAVAFYKDKSIEEKLAIGEDATGGVSIPIIAGATVTSLILHETVLESSREIAVKFGIIENLISEGGLNNNFRKYSWDELIKIKAVKHYALDQFLNNVNNSEDVNLLVDIYFADLTHRSIGRNILGPDYYDDFLNDLEGKSVILILNNGTWSFKGSGFVRGGIFDRFRIEQDGNIFTFRDSDFKNVYNLDLVDIDDYRESGMFIINNAKYKPWKSWNLILLLNYKTFSVEYKIPDVFLIKETSKIAEQWNSKFFNISLLICLWFFVVFVFLFRDVISKNNFYLSIIYNFVLLLDVYIIGILLHGQPSVVNLYAIKKLETFLWDPYLCVGWIMILLTIFIWGKSIFCGWICPFGALQEIIFKFRSIIFNDSSLEFSDNVFNKIRYLRYLILFFLIFIAIFYGVALAELCSEIEPFKTIWSVGLLNRPWYVSLYTILLLIVSIFTYRFFCRILCPLGAFLSVLSFLTIFRLKRRNSCTFCKKCGSTCNSKAISEDGKIDPKECFGCFTCVNNMYNNKICPPLISKKVWDKYEIGIWQKY
ncbi:MAG TPA: 4Fe-4S binding protein [Candidatus Azoamicus sp.]